MKKHEGILKRVKQVEEKRGIIYARTDGKLCKTLSIINLFSAIFALCMNLFYVLGTLLINLGKDNMKNVLPVIITVSVCSVLLILGLIFKKVKLYITSAIINVLSSCFLISVFGRLMQDINGFLHLKTNFYLRHFIPLATVIVLTVWITVIALREKKKFGDTYRKVEENLYNMYHTCAKDITEEQWQEFLDNYNGESPNKTLNEN